MAEERLEPDEAILKTVENKLKEIPLEKLRDVVEGNAVLYFTICNQKADVEFLDTMRKLRRLVYDVEEKLREIKELVEMLDP